MDVLIDFLLNNYVWFIIMALIIVFALIGYIVDSSTLKEDKKTPEIKPIAKVDEVEVKVHPSVEAYTNDDFDDPLM